MRRRLERYEPNVDFDYADEDVFYERSGKATPPVGAVRVRDPHFHHHPMPDADADDGDQRERISRNTWTPTRKYLGHRDCVWEVTMAQARHACLGTASADRTARLWSPNYQSNVYNYAAHKGSGARKSEENCVVLKREIYCFAVVLVLFWWFLRHFWCCRNYDGVFYELILSPLWYLLW